MFAYVKCRCGRTLRAQRRPTRTTIRCWDCHSEVVVPRFRSPEGPGPVDRLREAMVSARAETAAAVFLLALGITAVIAIPMVGIWMALGVLIGAAFVYIRRIEHAGRSIQPEDLPEPVRTPGQQFARSIGRLAMATGLVGGLVLVPWLADGSRQLEPVSPLLPPPILLVIGVALLILLPVVVYLLTARDESGPLGPRLALAAAWRRKWSSAFAILLPALVISAMEVALLGLLLGTGTLGTFVLDLFPMPPGDRIDFNVYVVEGGVDFDRQEVALENYTRGLQRGATLVGSVPISFNRGLYPRIVVPAYGPLGSESYLLARLGVTLAVMLSLLTALMFQGDLFGIIGLSAPSDEDEDEGEGEDGQQEDEKPEPRPASAGPSEHRPPVEADADAAPAGSPASG